MGVTLDANITVVSGEGMFNILRTVSSNGLPDVCKHELKLIFNNNIDRKRSGFRKDVSLGISIYCTVIP